MSEAPRVETKPKLRSPAVAACKKNSSARKRTNERIRAARRESPLALPRAGQTGAGASNSSPRVGTMSARTALMNLARRAAKAPVQVSRRHMSGGGTIEEEIGA